MGALGDILTDTNGVSCAYPVRKRKTKQNQFYTTAFSVYGLLIMKKPI